MNIIFDIGMVLADFRWHDYALDRGIPEESIKLLAERMILHPDWNRFDKGAEPYKEVIEDFAKRFPECPADFRRFWEDVTDMVYPFDYSEEWLASLRSQGHKIYLLSNYSEFLFEVHSKKFTFMKHIDGKVISYEYKTLKPYPEIYHILLDKYSLDPAECVFIDDRPENAEGAEKCGITGITFTGYEDACGKLAAVIAEKSRSVR